MWWLVTYSYTIYVWPNNCYSIGVIVPIDTTITSGMRSALCEVGTNLEVNNNLEGTNNLEERELLLYIKLCDKTIIGQAARIVCEGVGIMVDINGACKRTETPPIVLRLIR